MYYYAKSLNENDRFRAKADTSSIIFTTLLIYVYERNLLSKTGKKKKEKTRKIEFKVGNPVLLV